MMQKVNLSYPLQQRSGGKWEFTFVKYFCTLNLIKLQGLRGLFYKNYKNISCSSRNIIQMMIFPKEKVIHSLKWKTFPKKN
jgi:hypothetical protein